MSLSALKSSFLGLAFPSPNLLIVLRIIFCSVIAICLSIIYLLENWKQFLRLLSCISTMVNLIDAEYVSFLLSAVTILDLLMKYTLQ